MTAAAAIPQDKLVAFDDLAPNYGIYASKCTLWKWEKEGKFPRRLHLSHTRVAWRHSEIMQWIADLRPATRAPSVLPRAVVSQQRHTA